MCGSDPKASSHTNLSPWPSNPIAGEIMSCQSHKLVDLHSFFGGCKLLVMTEIIRLWKWPQERKSLVIQEAFRRKPLHRNKVSILSRLYWSTPLIFGFIGPTLLSTDRSTKWGVSVIQNWKETLGKLEKFYHNTELGTLQHTIGWVGGDGW